MSDLEYYINDSALIGQIAVYDRIGPAVASFGGLEKCPVYTDMYNRVRESLLSVSRAVDARVYLCLTLEKVNFV